jgi:hypothetical protein
MDTDLPYFRKEADAQAWLNGERSTRNIVVFNPDDITQVKRDGEEVYNALVKSEKATPQNALTPDDYGMEHRPPMRDSGAPAHDLTGGGSIYPDDVYSSNAARYYGHGDDALDNETVRIAQSLRNRPNADVVIYRAVAHQPNVAEQITQIEKQKAAFLRRGRVPSGYQKEGYFDMLDNELQRLKGMQDDVTPQVNKINPGDWVTINKKYAKAHGEGIGGYKIIQKKVKARDIFTNGDSIHEWGYDPQEKVYNALVKGERAGSGNALGKPIKAYHGTYAKDIDEFETMGNVHQRVQGAYFTKTEKHAAKYAGLTSPTAKKGGKVVAVEIDLKNPATREVLDEIGYGLRGDEMRDELIKRGYDGVVDDLQDEIIAFYPEQIKK